ncbi:efflux RND transporter permease subunit [Pseudomarimonas arenosa]|uniref:MMPL family transporter n=1 Tax=Pseudomarimonas arenosa TaxID=2774145 RepID=A0AAW3ZI98_9GAMM|nr:MMPL family transporter [Pseudomarimonas arenosa]MBD8525244.1 MMPL family transporter [Pseudomarimonas arenosa]
MSQRLWRASVAHPRRVFLLTAVLCLLAMAAMPRVKIDTDPENMLAATQPERVFHNETKRRFALHDMIVVGQVSQHAEGIYNPQSLAALHRLNAEIAKLDGVIRADLMSLATVDNIRQAGLGTVRFEWLMSTPPADQAGALDLNAQLSRLPMFDNTLVSGDDKAAAIYVPIADKNQAYRIGGEIERLVAGLDSSDSFHITGLPIAEDRFGYEMFVQMAICAPLAALVIYLLMWLFFRNALFVAAPMLVAMGSVIITMGLLIGLGFSVHIMSSMIAIFLMPIAVVDAIHILSDFSERYRPGDDPKQVIESVLNDLFKPMLYTSLTTAVGFASLLLTPIPPVQIFGAFVAFGILLAFLLTLTLLPAFVASLSPKALQALTRHSEGGSLLTRWLPGLGRGALRARWPIVLLCLGLSVASAYGIARIEVNDNPTRWFKADHPIRVADRVLNQHFAGAYDAFMVLDNDIAALKDRLRDGWMAEADSAAQQLAIASLSQPGDLGPALQSALDRLDEGSLALDSELSDQWIERIEDAQRALAVFQQPEVLRYVEQLQAALQQSGLIGKSNALPDLVKTVHRELRSGEAEQFRIPDSQAAVAQTLLQFQSSHRPQDLWHFTTTDYRAAVVWLQLTSGDNQDMQAVEQWVQDYVAQHPLPDGLQLRWAGKTHLNRVWQGEMVTGMAQSLAGAFVVVLIMMIVLFRSLLLGLLAMLPLSLTIAFIYGAIGWLGKDYDMPIAVLSSLALGLSVDFAIHFIQRARAIYARQRDLQRTLAAMFDEPALAISRNAIVIAIGFTPLLLAPLVPYITVGYLLASIMAVSALVSLYLLTALLWAGNGWLLRHTAPRNPA